MQGGGVTHSEESAIRSSPYRMAAVVNECLLVINFFAPATGDLGHLCTHELQNPAWQRLIVGGIVSQLSSWPISKCKQTSILYK